MQIKFKLEIVTLFTEAALATLQFSEQVHEKFAPFQRLFENSTKAWGVILSAQVLVMFIYILLKLNVEFEKIVTSSDKISSFVEKERASSSTISTIHEQDFYPTFAKAVREATKVVYMAHLDNQPPPYIEGQAGHAYYRDLFNLIKNKNGIVINRVERVGKQKIKWIEELIDKLSGCNNFTLRVLTFDPNVSKSPYVSVQLVDHRDSYLVAVASHSEYIKPRDIWIRDEAAAEIWQSYYQANLWKDGVTIIDKGMVDRKKWQEIKSSIPK